MIQTPDFIGSVPGSCGCRDVVGRIWDFGGEGTQFSLRPSPLSVRILFPCSQTPRELLSHANQGNANKSTDQRCLGKQTPKETLCVFPTEGLKGSGSKDLQSSASGVQCAESTFSKNDLKAVVISYAQGLKGPGFQRADELLVNCLHMPHPTST